MAWVQEGMQSSAFPEGTLSSTEWGVRAFHQEIQKRLPVGSVVDEPLSGEVSRINAELARRAGSVSEGII